MIADTTVLIQFANEGAQGRRRPARTFLVQHRREIVRTSILNLAEVAAGFGGLACRGISADCECATASEVTPLEENRTRKWPVAYYGRLLGITHPLCQ